MNAIEMMNEEHRYITRMLKVVRKISFRILNGEDVNYDDFDSIIDFISNYADGHHHKKEEDILFNKMIEHIGEIAEKFVKQGMLVEHDFGRLYMRDLEQALVRLKAGDEEAKLDVISNAISYTHLLERHIDKEDRVIYKFAQRELNEEVLNLIDKECREYEANNLQEKDRCISVLEKLERKYI
ncbi:hemerythrin domain-containing protein [Paraclostridium bifermentans]|uniref:hemerythrin domain-containing protein n=1 Tax=Paraclostridium bifermentans TaxID=1490 RepID=UPI001FF5F73C|nr:hemerythrin domain-containing protein [Paraclostridium bifermentans]UOW69551.1 hemerythrin domain-containing protein [Paraclostridium bifermentans]